jgi:hypothetical protein
MSTSEREEPCHMICSADLTTVSAEVHLSLIQEGHRYVIVASGAYLDPVEAQNKYDGLAKELGVTR